MDLNQLHFAHPLWLGVGIAIPLVWVLYFLYQNKHSVHQLEKFIDRHLLPYLLIDHQSRKSSIWPPLLLWSVVWASLTIALAGPRWNLREMETFSKDQSLVILLDLSESMNAADINPTRLVRAKQKIEDLLNLSRGVKIGLIAFAADPHMITPITDDKETIRHILPTLETDLVYVQGSRLSSALEMSSTMLEAEPGNNKALLVISDGGFEDATAIITAKKIADKGIVIHVMGVGTAEGILLSDARNIVNITRSPIVTRLEKERLNEISNIGNGRYLEVHYSDHEEEIILKELENRADAAKHLGKKHQFWDEYFYLFILPALPILLWWFRRGSVFAMIFILFTTPIALEASGYQDYFKNSEELGKLAFDAGDYDKAIDTFQDPYRKGVACYKAKKFAEAEMMFRQSTREEVASSAAYNLGNALVQQQKLKEAIEAYENVLEKWPDHNNARENLELVKKMLEQQKQNDSNSENSDQQENQSESESESKNENQSQDSGSPKENEERQENPQKQNDKDADGQDEQQKNEEQQESAKETPENREKGQEEQQGMEQSETALEEKQQEKAPKSQEDQDADLWLNRLENDPKTFMKNKFYIESKNNGTKEGIDPW